MLIHCSKIFWFISRVIHPASGRVLDMYTTEPGVQFYTAFYMDGQAGKGGVIYKKNGGFTLEAQHYPNSPNEVITQSS